MHTQKTPLVTPAAKASAIAPVTRRDFLRTTSTALAGASMVGAMSVGRSVFAAADSPLKIALIGCGGRGTAAAIQALNTGGPTKLVAMADAFDDRLGDSLKKIADKHPNRVDVPKERQFFGFDGYKQAISAADVVILATPPGFRPDHFEEAVPSPVTSAGAASSSSGILKAVATANSLILPPYRTPLWPRRGRVMAGRAPRENAARQGRAASFGRARAIGQPAANARWRRLMAPTRPKPAISRAQLAGSGTTLLPVAVNTSFS